MTLIKFCSFLLAFDKPCSAGAQFRVRGDFLASLKTLLEAFSHELVGRQETTAEQI